MQYEERISIAKDQFTKNIKSERKPGTKNKRQDATWSAHEIHFHTKQLPRMPFVTLALTTPKHPLNAIRLVFI